MMIMRTWSFGLGVFWAVVFGALCIPGCENQDTTPNDNSNSDDDNASEISEYADEISIEARLEAELRDVAKALGAVEKGTYGTCKYCGKDIDIKRLAARPASSSCIDCKKLLTQEM